MNVTKGRRKPSLDSLFALLRQKGVEPGSLAGWDEEDRDKSYRALLASGTSWKNLPLACVSVELLAARTSPTRFAATCTW
jgi:hypothetical protein